MTWVLSTASRPSGVHSSRVSVAYPSLTAIRRPWCSRGSPGSSVDGSMRRLAANVKVATGLTSVKVVITAGHNASTRPRARDASQASLSGKRTQHVTSLDCPWYGKPESGRNSRCCVNTGANGGPRGTSGTSGQGGDAGIARRTSRLSSMSDARAWPRTTDADASTSPSPTNSTRHADVPDPCLSAETRTGTSPAGTGPSMSTETSRTVRGDETSPGRRSAACAARTAVPTSRPPHAPRPCVHPSGRCQMPPSRLVRSGKATTR